MSFTYAEPGEWWLEIPASLQAESWQESQQQTMPGSRWNAYLNRICLHSVLTWMQTEYAADAAPWIDRGALPAVWEVVNGTAIEVGTTRFVVLPTEAMDDAELEVPQEWIDIPAWAGDYYLSAQLQPEGDWLRIWGYATHQDIKTLGQYDASDRRYSLPAEQLIRDLAVLGVSCRCCPDAHTRAEILPLPVLPAAQAETLIQRLSQPAIGFPRLTVPFSLWGSLMAQPDWRQQLYQQRRTGLAAARVCLGDWLQGRIAALWQSVDAVLSPQQVRFSWRSPEDGQVRPSSLGGEFQVSRVKVLDFGLQPGTEQVGLVIGVAALDQTEWMIGIQICPVGAQRHLPRLVRLRLLDGTGAEMGQVSAAVTETIQLQFRGDRGEQFQIEVTCGDKTLTEAFVI